MNKKKLLSLGGALLLGTYFLFAQKQPVDYVNPLMGTDSKISLSNGNTYHAIALPWGMNFWMPQTGKSVASSKPTSLVPGSMTTDSFQSCQ